MDSLFLSVMAVLANADLIPFLIALLIGIPSAVLYCLELTLIVTNFAAFGAPFFSSSLSVQLRVWLITFFSFLALRFGVIGLFLPVYLKMPRVMLAFDDHKTANAFFNNSEIAAWSAVLFVIICLLLNLVILFAYKIRHFGKQNDQSSALERKMTIYTVVTFFGELTGTVFMLIIYVTATAFVDEQNNGYSLAQKWFGITLAEDDILFLANFNQYPWINSGLAFIMGFDKNARNHFLKIQSDRQMQAKCCVPKERCCPSNSHQSSLPPMNFFKIDLFHNEHHQPMI